MSSSGDEAEIPGHLLCPISLELMREPTITPAGHTYEREVIEEVARDLGEDPFTREPLRLQDLKPNRALKLAIEDYLKQHPEMSSRPTTPPATGGGKSDKTQWPSVLAIPQPPGYGPSDPDSDGEAGAGDDVEMGLVRAQRASSQVPPGPPPKAAGAVLLDDFWLGHTAFLRYLRVVRALLESDSALKRVCEDRNERRAIISELMKRVYKHEQHVEAFNVFCDQALSGRALGADGALSFLLLLRYQSDDTSFALCERMLDRIGRCESAKKQAATLLVQFGATAFVHACRGSGRGAADALSRQSRDAASAAALVGGADDKAGGDAAGDAPGRVSVELHDVGRWNRFLPNVPTLPDAVRDEGIGQLPCDARQDIAEIVEDLEDNQAALAALKRLHECVEVYLDVHKEKAFSSALLEPARLYFQLRGSAHHRDHANVHGLNGYLCLLRGGMGVQLPLIPLENDGAVHMGCCDHWTGLTDAAWRAFADPANFGKRMEAVQALPGLLVAGDVRNVDQACHAFTMGGPAAMEVRAKADPSIMPYLHAYGHFLSHGFLTQRMYEVLNSESDPAFFGFRKASDLLFQVFAEKHISAGPSSSAMGTRRRPLTSFVLEDDGSDSDNDSLGRGGKAEGDAPVASRRIGFETAPNAQRADPTSFAWEWQDAKTGAWTAFDPQATKLLESMCKRGMKSATLTHGEYGKTRGGYLVDFVTLTRRQNATDLLERVRRVPEDLGLGVYGQARVSNVGDLNSRVGKEEEESDDDSSAKEEEEPTTLAEWLYTDDSYCVLNKDRAAAWFEWIGVYRNANRTSALLPSGLISGATSAVGAANGGAGATSFAGATAPGNNAAAAALGLGPPPPRPARWGPSGPTTLVEARRWQARSCPWVFFPMIVPVVLLISLGLAWWAPNNMGPESTFAATWVPFVLCVIGLLVFLFQGPAHFRHAELDPVLPAPKRKVGPGLLPWGFPIEVRNNIVRLRFCLFFFVIPAMACWCAMYPFGYKGINFGGPELRLAGLSSADVVGELNREFDESSGYSYIFNGTGLTIDDLNYTASNGGCDVFATYLEIMKERNAVNLVPGPNGEMQTQDAKVEGQTENCAFRLFAEHCHIWALLPTGCNRFDTLKDRIFPFSVRSGSGTIIKTQTCANRTNAGNNSTNGATSTSGTTGTGPQEGAPPEEGAPPDAFNSDTGFQPLWNRIYGGQNVFDLGGYRVQHPIGAELVRPGLWGDWNYRYGFQFKSGRWRRELAERASSCWGQSIPPDKLEIFVVDNSAIGFWAGHYTNALIVVAVLGAAAPLLCNFIWVLVPPKELYIRAHANGPGGRWIPA